MSAAIDLSPGDADALVSDAASVEFGMLNWSQARAIVGVPAAVLAGNGLIVVSLKALQAPTWAYWSALPLLLLCGAGALYLARREGPLPKSWKVGLICSLALLFAVAQFMYFGPGEGSDAALYFSHPVHSFFQSGHLDLSEAPYVNYGKQPLAAYWLPYSSEYLVTAFASLAGASYPLPLHIMQIAANFLLALAMLTLLARFARPELFVPVGVISLLLLTLTLRSQSDIAGMSVFRAFENKGLIFGFYFWAAAVLFVGEWKRPNWYDGLWLTILLPVSAFFVSGNFPLVGLVGVGVALGAVAFSGRVNLIAHILAFVGVILASIVLYKLLETTDVMQVQGNDLLPRPAEPYTDQSTIYTYPLVTWGLAVLLGAASFRRYPAAASQLLLYVLLAFAVHSEWFYNFFVSSSPERAEIFWRVAILFNPTFVVVVGLVLVSESLWQTRPMFGAALVGIMGAGTVFLFVTAPLENPYPVSSTSTAIASLGQLCSPGATVLGNAGVGSFVSVQAPQLVPLHNKTQFLNWQIANLVPGSPDAVRATLVRDAVLHLSRQIVSPDSVAGAVSAEMPDAVLANKAALRDVPEQVWANYRRADLGENLVLLVQGERCVLPEGG